jgi:hypothetical protein
MLLPGCFEERRQDAKTLAVFEAKRAFSCLTHPDLTVATKLEARDQGDR